MQCVFLKVPASLCCIPYFNYPSVTADTDSEAGHVSETVYLQGLPCFVYRAFVYRALFTVPLFTVLCLPCFVYRALFTVPLFTVTLFTVLCLP